MFERILVAQRNKRDRGIDPKFIRVGKQSFEHLMAEVEAIVIEAENDNGDQMIAVAGMWVLIDDTKVEEDIGVELLTVREING